LFCFAVGASHVTTRKTIFIGQGRPELARSLRWGRLLWRWLPIAYALTERQARLRERLANRVSLTDTDISLVWAAVALILVPHPDSLLLIRRAERSGDPWAGHMALPGGRQEAADEDLVATAIRETQEEVGVQLTRGHLVGALDDVIPRTPVLPSIAVRPFVFEYPMRPVLHLNPEVAAATWTTLDHLLNPETHHLVELKVAGKVRVVPAYELESGIVWGMTERMLTSLLTTLS
jgi:8-oxo-dGTP pyrophosphatase MutT (NUDIX family)